jgi:hypothetical protein
MWQFARNIFTWLSGLRMQRPSEPRPDFGGTVDWLPPVLGPAEWSLGLMSDLSAGWYFDRDRA